MDLVVNDKIIVTSIYEIILQMKRELNNSVFDKIIKSGNSLKVTCPNREHKGGHERHPSCYISTSSDLKVPPGTTHCFSCGFSMSLPKLVGYCFEEDEEFGKQWLLSRFNTSFISEINYLPEISFERKIDVYNTVLDEKELEKYSYYHTYMWERNISKEIIDRFEVGYDPKQNMLVFPVRDEKGILRFITGRSVQSHRFMIPEDVVKPVYLLFYVLKNNIDKVIVCEGQIDALVSWSYGFPAVALFGAGTTQHQIDLLNKSGIFNFVLMYDNDKSGRHGAETFKRNIRDDKLVTDIIMPKNKDIADCTKKEFIDILIENNVLDKTNNR